ncbi:probable carboxyl-terminal protease, putative [gamma proteobacterium HTCC5015]|nr:probable carboxyl-terminal protease, putative [gamma proteobacterium HTCC5015]
MLGFFLAITSTSGAVDQQSSPRENESRPLFPIALEHPFNAPEETFLEVKDYLKRYYYSDQLNDEALYHAAIQGMLRHVSPPQSPELAKLWPATDFERFNSELDGIQHALGLDVRYSATDGSLTVTQTAPGSPAAKSLKTHDRIMRINGQALKGINAQQLSQTLAQAAKDSVTFTVVRDIEVFDVTLKSAVYDVQNLHLKRFQDSAYIGIKSVSRGVASALKKTLEKLEKEGIDHVIIDLRNNAGGDFYEGLALAELFLDRGTPLLYTLQNEATVEHYRSSNPEASKLQPILLINEYTASAAEVFAAALRDHQKARLVGTRSHGKATVEGTYKLDNGYYIKFIIAAMYSPRGQSWQSKGLLPDYFAESSAGKIEELQALPFKRQLQQDLPLATAWKLLHESN